MHGGPMCSRSSSWGFVMSSREQDTKDFLEGNITLIKGSITTNNTGRPGMEGGEAWARVRSLGRVKDLEQEL